MPEEKKPQELEAPHVGLSGDGVKPAEATQPAKQEAAPAAEPAKPAPKPEDDDKPFSMRPSAWREQKAQAERAANEKLAKDLGYDSVDEMKTALARQARKPAVAAAPKTDPTETAEQKAAREKAEKDAAAAQAAETPEMKAALAPMREKLRREIVAGREYQKKAVELEKQIEALQVEHAAKESEAELRDVCRAQGVTGDYVDDVMGRMHKKLAGMTDEQISTFNEEEWVASLREKNPFWFGEKTVPANTGNGDRATPPKPSASDATKRAGEAGAFDAMKATKAEVDARIASMGIPKPRVTN